MSTELITSSPLQSMQNHIESLQRELVSRNLRIAQLEESLLNERKRVDAVERGVTKLRKILGPLYDGLRMVYGEIDAMGIEGTLSESSPVSSAKSSVWEDWKRRLGEGPAKVIDALLLHGAKNTQQLAMLTGYHRTTVPSFIYKLNKAGLLNKNGGMFSLKEL